MMKTNLRMVYRMIRAYPMLFSIITIICLFFPKSANYLFDLFGASLYTIILCFMYFCNIFVNFRVDWYQLYKNKLLYLHRANNSCCGNNNFFMEKNTVKEIIKALKRLIYELKNGCCENLSDSQLKRLEEGFNDILSVEKEIKKW